MVFSCKAVCFGVLSGLNRSQHLALLTQELMHCLSHHALLQRRGSMLALALVTLQLEKLCPDWLALAADVLRSTQVRVPPSSQVSVCCSKSAIVSMSVVITVCILETRNSHFSFSDEHL